MAVPPRSKVMMSETYHAGPPHDGGENGFPSDHCSDKDGTCGSVQDFIPTASGPRLKRVLAIAMAGTPHITSFHSNAEIVDARPRPGHRRGQTPPSHSSQRGRRKLEAWQHSFPDKSCSTAQPVQYSDQINCRCSSRSSPFLLQNNGNSSLSGNSW